MTQHEQEAAALWDQLLTFTVRYQMYGLETKEELKKLIASQGAYGTGNRAYEAAFGQFIAQIEYIESTEC